MSMLTTEYMDIHAAIDYTQAGAGVAGILNGAKFILFTNAVTPTKQTTVGSLTQPTYGGYAPVVLTWSAGVRDANGDIVTLSQLLAIQQTGGPVAVSILGYGITDAAGTDLLLCEVFAVPLALVDDLSYYGVQIPFAPGAPQSKSALVTT